MLRGKTLRASTFRKDLKHETFCCVKAIQTCFNALVANHLRPKRQCFTIGLALPTAPWPDLARHVTFFHLQRGLELLGWLLWCSRPQFGDGSMKSNPKVRIFKCCPHGQNAFLFRVSLHLWAIHSTQKLPQKLGVIETNIAGWQSATHFLNDHVGFQCSNMFRYEFLMLVGDIGSSQSLPADHDAAPSLGHTCNLQVALSRCRNHKGQRCGPRDRNVDHKRCRSLGDQQVMGI